MHLLMFFLALKRELTRATSPRPYAPAPLIAASYMWFLWAEKDE